MKKIKTVLTIMFFTFMLAFPTQAYAKLKAPTNVRVTNTSVFRWHHGRKTSGDRGTLTVEWDGGRTKYYVITLTNSSGKKLISTVHVRGRRVDVTCPTKYQDNRLRVTVKEENRQQTKTSTGRSAFKRLTCDHVWQGMFDKDGNFHRECLYCKNWKH